MTNDGLMKNHLTRVSAWDIRGYQISDIIKLFFHFAPRGSNLVGDVCDRFLLFFTKGHKKIITRNEWENLKDKRKELMKNY